MKGYRGNTRNSVLRSASVKLAAFVAALGTACLLLPSAIGSVQGDVPDRVFTYSVHHPIHGEIGSYTNHIKDTGDEVSVRNEIRIVVKILFAVAHAQNGDNTEVWRNGRLVSYQGVTKENGEEIKITGRADGKQFVIETPEGRVEAPAHVSPNNPWSMGILKASVLMGTKSGSLYRVQVTGGEKRTVKVGAREVETRYYKVDGDAQYELWFDDRGIPVKFTDRRENGLITFKLVEDAAAEPKVIKGSLGGN